MHMNRVRESAPPAYATTVEPEPQWLTRALVDYLHDTSLALFGGLSGVNNENLVESALARPQNLFAYVEGDLPRLAAAYAFGFAKNHGYRDGNKRTAFTSCATFLDMNGLELVVDEIAALERMLELATDAISEEGFAEWLRAHVVPRG
ncbi:death-on-curing protein [Gemmatimonadetes bacterium T265]|nr:death-on-curing protein [Gemmatimonadetes bacterium T265]